MRQGGTLYNFVPFADKFLPDAAVLLAARHQRDRQRCPALPGRLADPAEALKAVRAAWQQPWASGAAILAGEQLVGYLFADKLFDQLLGRTAWVRSAGHALAEGVSCDLYKELYAAAAPSWLAYGCFDHYVMAAADDQELLAAWYSLGFGQQQAHGLRPIDLADGSPTGQSGRMTVRRAGPADRERFAAMAPLTAEYQVQAPVWAPVPAEIGAARPAMYGSVLDDEDAMLWLAEVDGQVIAFQVYYPAEPQAYDLFVPNQCAELAAAATEPAWRGQGASRALAQHALKNLYQQGYQWCLTDWRTANPLSSRAWPHLGYQRVVYRLHRRIDERILWARG